MNPAHDPLIQALRTLPTPEPRPEFVDAAIAKATSVARPEPVQHGTRVWLQEALRRWETWFGAAVGGVAAAVLAMLMFSSMTPHREGTAQLTLALHETRQIDVLIDSERPLQGATIRIAVSGGVALDGFDDEREIHWQADLERGNNLITLPVTARTAGGGQLVATIEHAGKARTVAVDLTVKDADISRT